MADEFPRPSIIQDYHEEQSTFELTCSGSEDDEPSSNSGPLATAILVSTEGKRYLITNWHVVTGRHPENDQQIGQFVPQVVFARENVLTGEGGGSYRIPLYAEDGPRWIESSRRIPVEGTKQRVDLAIIPFEFNNAGRLESTSTMQES
jgi:hypothetical protein